MNIEEFREYCLSKPHATEGTPFGPDTSRVQGCRKNIRDHCARRNSCAGEPEMRSRTSRSNYATATSKCDPGYHMNKKHWNTVDIEAGIPDAEIRKMIDHSYELDCETCR